MALWRCTACTTLYSVGAPSCPQCSSTEYEEDGAMPKIHKGRPDTHEADLPVEAEAEVEPAPAPRKRAPKGTRAQAGHAAGAGTASS